jgi:hypothetical protein
MRCLFAVCILLGVASPLVAQNMRHQSGTVIRMRMADCLGSQRGFMASMSGAPRPQNEELCPEYVLVSDKVVYVIVGKSSGALVPLAETVRFRMQKKELLVRVDDEDKEVRFLLREMVLRSEWERVHSNLAEENSQSAVSPTEHPPMWPQ